MINRIFPVPQRINDYNQTTAITNTLCIVGSDLVKETTVSYLESVLVERGFKVVKDHVGEEAQTILRFVEVTEQHGEEATKVEGYCLNIGQGNGAGITIAGADKDGMHYGVITLLQMIEEGTTQLPVCTIYDHPNILYRGYIEGFYGYPWSHEDRKDLMAFGGKYKLNSYIYAPKDDPYHRKSWRDLYPADKAAQIQELAEAGHTNNLNFVWTIHPGDTIDLESEEDFKSAIVKLEQLYTLGVRQFGVLFDDIGGYPNGLQQAQFINRIDTEFIKAKGDVRPLITVGTRYCEAWGPSMEEYFKPFVETLHSDIEIMWTGAATMSNISKEEMDSPKRTIGSDKNLSVWWNYPVNDYCDQKLLMGKIENLGTDIDNVNGFFSNPMNQAQASKQALFCIADHNWNPAAFNSEESFEASFKALAPEVAEALQIFAENSCYLKEDGGKSGAFLFDESWSIKEDVHNLQLGIEQGTDVNEYRERLLEKFAAMEASVATIKTECLNKNLIAELQPFMEALHHLAKAGQDIMESIEALDEKQIRRLEELNEKALRHLAQAQQCKVNRLKDDESRDFVVDVGTHIIKPFIVDTIEKIAVAAGIQTAAKQLDYAMNNIALASLGVTAEASSSSASWQGPDYAISGEIKGGKWCTNETHPHLTIDLKEPRNIKQYRIINCGHPEAGETKLWNTKQGQILASMDGENFTSIDEFKDNVDDVINRMLFEPTTARYIRLQIVEPAQISINGGGASRINAFELFDEAFPEQSRKVLASEMDLGENGELTIKDLQKGDVIALYTAIDATTPYKVIEELEQDKEEIVINDIDLSQFSERIFVERTARNYLTSVRTSKAL